MRGAILMETAVLIPVLVFMIAALCVLATRLSDYMYMNQTSRELAVKLARLPWMAEMGTPTRTWNIDLETVAGGGPGEEAAATCLDDLANPSYTGCGSITCNPCIDTVISWYIHRLIEAKKLFVDETITVSVKFGPPEAEDPSALNGLCFVTVRMQAPHAGWLFSLSGEIDVNARVPYVGNPVPNAGLGCALY